MEEILETLKRRQVADIPWGTPVTDRREQRAD